MLEAAVLRPKNLKNLMLSTILLVSAATQAQVNTSVFREPLERAPTELPASSTAFTIDTPISNLNAASLKISHSNGELAVKRVVVSRRVNGAVVAKEYFTGEAILNKSNKDLIVNFDDGSQQVTRIQIRVDGRNLDVVNTFSYELTSGAVFTPIAGDPNLNPISPAPISPDPVAPPAPQPPTNNLSCNLLALNSQLNQCQTSRQSVARLIDTQQNELITKGNELSEVSRASTQQSYCASDLYAMNQSIQSLQRQSSVVLTPGEMQQSQQLKTALQEIRAHDTGWRCTLINRHGGISQMEGASRGRLVQQLIANNCSESNCGKRRLKENTINCVPR